MAGTREQEPIHAPLAEPSGVYIEALKNWERKRLIPKARRNKRVSYVQNQHA